MLNTLTLFLKYSTLVVINSTFNILPSLEFQIYFFCFAQFVCLNSSRGTKLLTRQL